MPNWLAWLGLKRQFENLRNQQDNSHEILAGLWKLLDEPLQIMRNRFLVNSFETKTINCISHTYDKFCDIYEKPVLGTWGNLTLITSIIHKP